MEEKYGIPRSEQTQRTEYDYGPGKIIREDYPGGKAIRQVGDTKAIKTIPYRHQDWCDQDRIIIVEGEKCAEALWERGIPATCNAGGANKWPDGLNNYFEGKEVIIIPDNDKAGKEHAKLVRRKLKPNARSVKCILLDQLPGKGDVWDWFCNPNNTTEKLLGLLDGPESQGFGYSVLSISDLANLPEQEWLVEGLIPKVGVGSIYGAPASYKTFIALHIGLSVASGHSVAGRSVKAGKVLYSAHEGFYGLRKRLEPAVAHHRFDPNGFHLTQKSTPLDLCDTTEIEALIEEGDNYSLIIIDSLVKAMTDVDENSNSEVARVLKVAERLANAKECCVLLVDHSGKEAKGARGASAKLGNQDFCLSVKRDQQSSQISMKVEKQKDGPDNYTLYFNAVETEFEESESQNSSIIIKDLGETQTNLSIPKLAEKILSERQGQTIDELFASAEAYQNENGLDVIVRTSFNDTISRMVRQKRITKTQDRFFLKIASFPSDDISPPKGGMSSGDVGK